MLMYPNDDEVTRMLEEAWYASNIKKLPLSLAETIWGETYKDMIVFLFNMAAQAAEIYVSEGKPGYEKKNRVLHPVGIFEFETLYTSWLYKTVSAWVEADDGSIEDVEEVKKTLFTVAMKV